MRERKHRYAGTLILWMTAAFLLTASLSILRIMRESHQVTRKNQSPHEQTAQYECGLGKPGKLHRSLIFGDENSGEKYRILNVTLPDGQRGRHQLYLTVKNRVLEKHPTLSLAFRVNGKRVTESTLRKSELDYYRLSIELPESQFQHESANHLQIECLEGSFKGRILLIPDGWAYSITNIAMPLLGGLLLLLVLARIPPHRITLAVTSILLIMSAVYCYSLFPYKWCLLSWGPGFSDPGDIASAVLKNRFTRDMSKHPSFLPIMHFLYSRGVNLTSRELFNLSIWTSILGGINVLLIFLTARKIIRNTFIVAAVTVSYGFSFSAWLYSSLFETYVLSSLFINLLLLHMASGKKNCGFYVTPLFTIPCALAFPPLLVLAGLPLYSIWRNSANRMRSIFFSFYIIAVTGLGFAAGQHVIKDRYGAVEQEGGFATTAEIITRHADLSHFTAGHFTDVLAAQFVYGILGRPYGFRWSEGIHSVMAYASTPIGLLSMFILALICSFVSRELMQKESRHLLWIPALTLLPFLLFLWAYNPKEMLLRSSQFMPMVFLGYGKLLASRSGKWVVPAAVALSLAILAINTVNLTSY